jgi:hypothetical protein
MTPIVLLSSFVITAVVPRWEGPLPNNSLPASGLPVLQGTRRVTVFNSSLSDGSQNPVGLYNHGPMLTRDGIDGDFICMWYNAPQTESHMMRVMMASTQPTLFFDRFVFPSLEV